MDAVGPPADADIDGADVEDFSQDEMEQEEQEEQDQQDEQAMDEGGESKDMAAEPRGDHGEGGGRR